MFTIDALWLTFVVGTVLPALVALVTKRFASSQFKGVLLAVLSAVTGVVTSVQANGGVFDIKAAIGTAVITFVTAVATHYGLLKPAGVTGASGAVARKVPGGVG